jgi:hypothetical protein
MRHFALLVLVISASLHANPQVPENAGVQSKGTSSHASEADGKIQQRQPEPALTRDDTSKAPENTPNQEKHNNQRNSDDRAYRVDIVSQLTSGWTIAYVLITAFLGAIGAVTLGVLIYQNINLGKQVRLQERAQRQWVNTSEWKAVLTDRQLPDGRNILEVSFKISNLTHAPIMLILVSINSEDHEIPPRGDAFSENTMLLPRNPFRHSIRIPLSKEEYFDYVREGAILRLNGMIVYTDALEDSWRQSFRLLLVASSTSTTLSNYFHTLGRVNRLTLTTIQPFWRKAVHWWVAQVEAMKNGES